MLQAHRSNESGVMLACHCGHRGMAYGTPHALYGRVMRCRRCGRKQRYEPMSTTRRRPTRLPKPQDDNPYVLPIYPTAQ